MSDETKHPFSVGISVSPCETSVDLGFDAHVLNRITIRIAQYFLSRRAKVVFGHDWREDGVMRAVAKMAEQSYVQGEAHGEGRLPWSMINVVPTAGGKVSHLAQVAHDSSGGVLRATPLSDFLNSKETDSFESVEARGLTIQTLVRNNTTELWALRKSITELLNPGGRICLGGKDKGYGGYYAGIAEEAYYAMLYRKPLYLLGGFGGATSAVISALKGEPSGGSLQAPLRKEDIPQHLRDGAEVLRMPLEGLADSFAELGFTEGLTGLNGLSLDDNETLARTTDVEVALELIRTGMTEVLNRSD